MNKAVQCAVALFVLVASARGQRIASVDLTNSPDSAKSSETQKADILPNGCEKLEIGGYVDGVVKMADGHPQPVIEVEVIRINEKVSAVGSELKAEVRLRNTGRETIYIPWSPDPNTIQNAQDPSHLAWGVGDFVVLLNGTTLTNHTQRLFGSKFSPGSQLTIRRGEWVTATIKFKLENQLFPNRLLEVGESRLSIEWKQANRSRETIDCKVTFGDYEYGGTYLQKNPTKMIRVIREAPSQGERGRE